MNIREALRLGLSELTGKTNEPKESAEFLLSHAIKEGFSYLRIHPDRELTETEEGRFKEFVEKRKDQVPLWQIVGTETFYGLPIYADSRVLVPRPETEFLVDKAISLLKEKGPIKVLDMGTGAGGIACALAANLPEASVTASDISAEALEVAKLNVEKNGLSDRIKLVRSDLFKEIEGRFDAVVANLPYVPEEDISGLAFEIHHYEPKVALSGGAGGIKVYESFFNELTSHITDRYCVFLEIGAKQGEKIVKMAQGVLPNAKVSFEKDLAGHDRYVIIHN